MKASEKQQLNTLIDTAFSWASGFPVGVCAGKPEPVFTDDVVPNLNFNSENIPNVQNVANTTNAIEIIAKKISTCTRCQLAKMRTQTVPGVGVMNPQVLVIGEGPGADEDRQGEPFVGLAGQLLDKMLAAISLSRKENCFIANIVKCRPPHNRDPLPEEADACRSFLDAQIQILKPKIILALGRIAAHNLLNCTEPVGKLHGNFFEYKGIPLMVTYHPSALLRDQAMKRPAWEDLKKFRLRLNEILETGQN